MKKFKNCQCQDIPQKAIHKIGAAFVKDKKIIVVRKKGTGEYIVLGGVHDRNESHEENLRKEAREELQLELEKFSFLGRFADIALYEKVPIIMDVYLVECQGEPRPDSEIKEYLWLDKDYDKSKITLGTILEKHVIPTLVNKDLM